MGTIEGVMNGLYMSITISPKNELRGTMNSLDRLFISDEITRDEWKEGQNKAIKKYRKSFK